MPCQDHTSCRITFITIIVSLAVLTATRVFTARAEPMMEGKAKKLPTAPVLSEAIPWLKCSACVEMVAVAYDETLDFRATHVDEGKYGLPREEDIMEEVLENICNPFHKKGMWIRQLKISPIFDKKITAEASSSDSNTDSQKRRRHGDEEESEEEEEEDSSFDDKRRIAVGLEIEPLKYQTKCRSHCFTIADACQKVHDSTAADKLSSMLYAFKKSRRQMQESVCRSSCAALDRWIMQSSSASGSGNSKKDNQPSASLLKKLADDLPQKAEGKEVDVEEMMDRMQRTTVGGSPKMDVYDRETITTMHEAIMSGTKEEAAAFDPELNDLSDEDFAVLQEMFRSEKGL